MHLRVQLNNKEAKSIFQELENLLISCVGAIHSDLAWRDIRTAVKIEMTSVSNLNRKVQKNQII